MKKLFTIFLILAWLPLAHADKAELVKGHEAYKVGDYKTATSIWKSLAEEGNVEAQSLLGLLYYQGKEGVAQNYNNALKWFTKAAEQGEHASQLYLGLMYEEGKGIPQNYNNAVKWYQKSAKQGNVVAQSLISLKYAKGKGAPKNYILAYMWGSIAKANDKPNDITSIEEFLKVLEKQMTPTDISKAQDLAAQCWESNYQNCGE